MVVNELGEWESESEEEDAPCYDEEIENDENEIQPEEGDDKFFISREVLSVTDVKGEEWTAAQSFPYSRHDQG